MNLKQLSLLSLLLCTSAITIHASQKPQNQNLKRQEYQESLKALSCVELAKRYSLGLSIQRQNLLHKNDCLSGIIMSPAESKIILPILEKNINDMRADLEDIVAEQERRQ